jgi:hypothetical protein
MASSRRGRSRGFAPPELRGTLGTLLRTTLVTAREALERSAREGRARFDDVRRERRRADALAELGERVLARIRRGEAPELEAAPDIADAVAALEELEARPAGPGAGRDRDDVPGRDWVAPETRARFDRGRARRDDDDAGAAPGGDAGDGTVSSASWRPPPARAPGARVWRPGEVDVEPAVIESTRPAREDATRPLRPGSEGGAKRGGIVFGRDEDDDADLAAYMHPDDVPPKRDA